jgi:hypothetical protein
MLRRRTLLRPRWASRSLAAAWTRVELPVNTGSCSAATFTPRAHAAAVLQAAAPAVAVRRLQRCAASPGCPPHPPATLRPRIVCSASRPLQVCFSLVIPRCKVFLPCKCAGLQGTSTREYSRPARQRRSAVENRRQQRQERS